MDIRCQVGIIGDHGAGVAKGTEILPGIETETTGRTHGTCFSAFVCCPVSLASILDHLQNMFLGDREDRIHIRRLTI